MTAPLRYSDSCVPIALAVLLELPVEEVGSLLWRRGHVSERQGAGSTSQLGTRTDLACDVALRLGHRIQQWNPDGTLFLSAPEFVRYVRAVAHREATTVAPLARVAPVPPPDADDVLHLDGDPEPSEAPRLLTVREWRDRHPCGRWMLVVHDGEQLAHHALALVSGEIEAGGESYRDAPIVRAFRFLPPKSLNLKGTPQ